jgi:hypothetical protein
MSNRCSVVLVSLALLVLSLVPLPASAASSCYSGEILDPGEELCTGTVYAPNSAEAMGSGHLRNVRFKVYWSASSSGPFQVAYDVTALSFTVVWPPQDPSQIPGYFYACAKRPASYTNPATVDLCMTGE